jgi:hypothetical protein
MKKFIRVGNEKTGDPEHDSLIDELADLPTTPTTALQPIKKVKLTKAQLLELIQHGTIGGK